MEKRDKKCFFVTIQDRPLPQRCGPGRTPKGCKAHRFYCGWFGLQFYPGCHKYLFSCERKIPCVHRRLLSEKSICLVSKPPPPYVIILLSFFMNKYDLICNIIFVRKAALLFISFLYNTMVCFYVIYYFSN